jgi:hypothetical protein
MHLIFQGELLRLLMYLSSTITVYFLKQWQHYSCWCHQHPAEDSESVLHLSADHSKSSNLPVDGTHFFVPFLCARWDATSLSCKLHYLDLTFCVYAYFRTAVIRVNILKSMYRFVVLLIQIFCCLKVNWVVCETDWKNCTSGYVYIYI